MARQGRAFRVIKRTAHLTVQVSERPVHVAPQPATAEPAGAHTRAVEGAPKRPRGAKPKAKPAPKRSAKASAKTTGAQKKKKTATKSGRAKKAKKS